jgi:hypothetical protein
MEFIKTIKWGASIAGICSSGLLCEVNAINISIDPANFLGELNFGGGGKNQQESYINQLVSMNLNATFSEGHKTFTRSANGFDSLPVADFEIQASHDHKSVVLDGTADYLLARYGSLTAVWYVGGLTGSFDLPAKYKGNSGNLRSDLGLPGEGTVVNVPDNGSALALMGLGIAALGVVGRFYKSRVARNNSPENL